MKTVFDESAVVKKLLPEEKVREGVTYRTSRYAVREEVPEGVLCYHVLLKKLTLLSPEEDRVLRTADPTSELFGAFVREYYLVPEGFDELKTVGELRGLLKLLQKKRPVTKFTILPTTDCNARCFYCFEAGCRREDMTMETAEKAAAFILKASGNEPVKLHLFGGEPLYRPEPIDRITSILEKAGKEYSSDMVTNGYLLGEEAIRKAVGKWHLKTVQITLDGTEDVYNRRKAYIYRSGNPFETVMENIGSAGKAGIAVEVRLNADAKNREDLISLVGKLKTRFQGIPNVRCYVRMLYGEYENPAAYKAYYAVTEALQKAGISRETGLSRRLSPNRCMADSGDSVVILPDGSLTSCEHFSEIGPAWGTTEDPSGFLEAMNSWSEEYPKDERCLECARMADCIRLKRCPVAAQRCSDLERKQRNREVRAAMIAEWRRFLQKEQNDQRSEA